MKKFLALCFAVLGICGFESMSSEIGTFEVINNSENAWEVEQEQSVIKAYNKDFEFELTIYADNFMPGSPQCVSNKRIKDIKFDIDIYKRAQKGDTGWAKMVERMKIKFSGSGIYEEKKLYGSNLIKNNIKHKEGDAVHIGTVQFLAPITCDKTDNMNMKIYGLKAGSRLVPTLDLTFKTQQ